MMHQRTKCQWLHYFRSKDTDTHANVVCSTHHVSKSHAADGIQASIEDIGNRDGVWVERFWDEVEEQFPNFVHDIQEPKKSNLVKLQGERVWSDTFPKSLKLGQALAKIIDEIYEETNTPIATVNGILMKTQVEPRYNHQRNVWLNGVNVSM